MFVQGTSQAHGPEAPVSPTYEVGDLREVDRAVATGYRLFWRRTAPSPTPGDLVKPIRPKTLTLPGLNRGASSNHNLLLKSV